MHIPSRQGVWGCLLSLVVLLSGCTTSSTDTQFRDELNSTQQISGITVEKRSIVPTFSEQAIVEQAPTFVLSTSQRGVYRPAVKVNDVVKAGQVLGRSNGVEIVSPVDAAVRKVAEAAHLPKHFPVFELEYQGFAVSLEAPKFLALTPIESISGKFQIQDGIGPTDILAVVSAPSNQDQASETVYDDEELEIGSHPRIASQTLLCLIDKAQPVRPGQVATVVLKGTAKTEVLAVPVSSVAGRLKKGSVTLVKGDSTSLAEVKLGVTDGAYIEITSGLSEGDVISAAAPYLDPRKK